MEGLSEPTGNLVPPALGGFNPALKIVKYDPEGAKKLLAQAGYPNGFGLTIHTPNNRYVNDEKIAQTVAQMFARVGIMTKVEGSPMAVFATHAARHEFSMNLFGWGGGTGDSSSPLRSLLACENAEAGFGGFNHERYCNPKMDEMLVMALRTVDDKARVKLLQDAAALGLNDVGIIPLHQQVATWATRKGYAYTARTDERTMAYAFSKQ
jgi:peptide/nickel transport system substrate-binding protein